MNGSYRHGTEEGFKKYKCRCVRCTNWNAPQIDTVPVPLPESPPPVMETPDIVPYLRAARFNRIEIEQISGEWAVTITTNGDRYAGFGHLPDHAFYAAVKRVQSSDPTTGPVTVTYDQRTLETSLGRALSDGDTEMIEKIWDVDETSEISLRPQETTLEGLVIPKDE